jgi:hypothetical protein
VGLSERSGEPRVTAIVCPELLTKRSYIRGLCPYWLFPCRPAAYNSVEENGERIGDVMSAQPSWQVSLFIHTAATRFAATE